MLTELGWKLIDVGALCCVRAFAADLWLGDHQAAAAQAYCESPGSMQQAQAPCALCSSAHLMDAGRRHSRHSTVYADTGSWRARWPSAASRAALEKTTLCGAPDRVTEAGHQRPLGRAQALHGGRPGGQG